MNALATWILGLFTFAVPVDKAVVAQRWTYETVEQRQARYEAIAEDLAAVALDPGVEPIFDGENSRAQSAGLGAAIIVAESALALDADVGPCVGNRCDGGRAVCLMQIQPGPGRTIEGWTKRDLFEDRRKCFKVGFRLLRRSMFACRNNPVEFRLAAFTSGNCVAGREAAADRRRLYHRLLNIGPMPGSDDFLMTPAHGVTFRADL